MESSKIQSLIMRRVYYTYALSVLTRTMFLQGVFLGVAIPLLARWLHVASIIHNFLSIPVGRVPSYIYGSFSHAISSGEVITAITFMATGIVTVSVGYKVTQFIMSRLQMLSQVM